MQDDSATEEEGLDIRIDEKPGAVLMFYNRVN